MRIAKIFSSKITDIKQRLVKVLRLGRDDTRQGLDVGPPGDDSPPVKDMVAIYSDTGVKGEEVVVGYIDKNKVASPGEKRFFSRDSNGNEATFLFMRNDGTIEIAGDGDHIVRYSELKNAFDELKSDLNDLITIFNTHSHAYTSDFTTPTSPPSTSATSSSADVSGSKVDEVKTTAP